MAKKKRVLIQPSWVTNPIDDGYSPNAPYDPSNEQKWINETKSQHLNEPDYASPQPLTMPQFKPLAQPKKLNLLQSIGAGLKTGAGETVNDLGWMSSKLSGAAGRPGVIASTLLDKKISDYDRQKQLEGHNTAYNIAKSIPNLAEAFIPGVGLGLSAASAAGQGGMQSQNAGKGEVNQFGNALVKGALNYGLMKVPVGSIGRFTGNTVKDIGLNALKGAGIQGAAAGLMDIGNAASDKAFVDRNTKVFDPSRILQSVAGGAVLGGIMGGVARRPIEKPVINPISKDIPKLLNPKGKLSVKSDALIPMDNLPNNGIKPSIGANDRTNLNIRVVSGKPVIKPTNILQKAGNAYNKFYDRGVDSLKPIKDLLSEDSYIKATNSKKVGGTVGSITGDNLVNMQGNVIGEGLGKIAKDIPLNEEKDFFEYILQKHNIDRAKDITEQVPKVDSQGYLVKDKNGNQVYNTVMTKKATPIDPSWSSEQSQKAAKLIEQKHPEYKVLGKRLTDFINKFESEWGNKSGLISDDLWKQLQDTYKNYVPTDRSFTGLEEGITKTNGRGFVNQDNTLRRATGSEKDVKNPIENVMNLVNRTARTARYNEVGQSMLQDIRSNPAKFKDVAEIIPEGTAIDSKANNVVSVLEDGKPVNVEIKNKRLLDALQGIYKTNDVNKLSKYTLGLFKDLVTNKNPVFAVKNVMRDVPTAYINGSEKNPFKFGKDYVNAYKELGTNSPLAQRYRGMGGESANFINTDKLYKSADKIMNRKLITDEEGQIIGGKKPNVIKNGLQTVGNKVEKFNTITESAPRFAEFKRVLNKTGDVQKALYAAGEVTTNFSRSGDITKKLDSTLVPYLNAGVQGLDKLARQLNPANPKQAIGTLIKGGIGITAPTMLFHYVNMDNPNYNSLDNRTKDNYYLIPNAFGEKDDKGNAKTFIKIPKSREYGLLFGTLLERGLRIASKDPGATKGLGDTIKNNVAPANPFTDNFLAPALKIALGSNKDFAGRDIVPQSMIMDQRSKWLQADDTSTELSKKIAELAHNQGMDLSPKQMDYLMKSYLGVIAQVGQPLLTKNTLTNGTTMGKVLKPFSTQFTADPLYNNQNVNDFYDNYDKIMHKATDKNLLEKIPSKVVTPEEKLKSEYTKASKSISDLNKQIREAEAKNDTEEIKRLKAQILSIALKTNQSFYSNSLYSNK